jgi:hypothetical protein
MQELYSQHFIFIPTKEWPKILCLLVAGFSSLWVRAGAYYRVEHLKGVSLVKAVALPANIRLEWKDVSRSNTKAYLPHSYVTEKINCCEYS